MNALRRMIAFAVCTAIGAAAIEPAMAQSGDDEQAIRKLIESHATAWNRRDIQSAAAVYSDQANVVAGADHRLFLGRAAVEELHTAALSRPDPDAHTHPPDTVRIYFIRPDIAIADVESHWFAHDDPGTSGAPLRKVPLFIVLERTGREWRVAAQRPTTLPVDRAGDQ